MSINPTTLTSNVVVYLCSRRRQRHANWWMTRSKYLPPPRATHWLSFKVWNSQRRLDACITNDYLKLKKHKIFVPSFPRWHNVEILRAPIPSFCPWRWERRGSPGISSRSALCCVSYLKTFSPSPRFYCQPTTTSLVATTCESRRQEHRRWDLSLSIVCAYVLYISKCAQIEQTTERCTCPPFYNRRRRRRWQQQTFYSSRYTFNFLFKRFLSLCRRLLEAIRGPERVHESLLLSDMISIPPPAPYLCCSLTIPSVRIPFSYFLLKRRGNSTSTTSTNRFDFFFYFFFYSDKLFFGRRRRLPTRQLEQIQ